MEPIEQRIDELKARYGDRTFFNFQEVREITELGKDAIYDLLADKRLVAHNPRQRPGGRGTRILACSVWEYLRSGVIPAERYSE